MTLEKVDLKNLPAVWKKKTEIAEQIEKEIDEAEEAKIDGSAMTVNPEEKFRKKRIVTPAKETKYKRVAKVQEFLNYCRFRVGELEVCEKPSAYIIKVFYNYKANRLDKIPQGYMAAINTHKDLINRAINVDLRSTSNSKNAKATKQATTLRNRAKENFEHWLRIQLGLDNGEKKASVSYAQYVRRWQLHKKEKVIKNLADYVRAICDEYADKLKAYVVLPEGRLVTCGSKEAKNYLNNKRTRLKSKEVKNKIQNVAETSKPKEHLATISTEVIELRKTIETLQNDNEQLALYCSSHPIKEQEMQGLRNENTKLQETVNTLKSDLQISKSTIKDTKKQFEALNLHFEDTIKQKDSIIFELKATIERLQNEVTKNFDEQIEGILKTEEKVATHQNDILDVLTTMLSIKGVKDFHITF